MCFYGFKLRDSPIFTRNSILVYNLFTCTHVYCHVFHISQVKGYLEDGLDEALQGCDIVVIPAGVPRKPGNSPHHLTVLHYLELQE